MGLPVRDDSGWAKEAKAPSVARPPMRLLEGDLGVMPLYHQGHGGNEQSKVPLGGILKQESGALQALGGKGAWAIAKADRMTLARIS